MIREEALRWFEDGENDISTANIQSISYLFPAGS